MSLSQITNDGGITTLTMTRGKVNALNEPMVEHLTDRFTRLNEDQNVNVVVLTGHGSFFSFGLDVPELYQYAKVDFIHFLKKFTNLYTLLFTFPKPVIAAINGHAIAGGCMLATACDARIMVTGKAKISLNEVTFGSLVFTGSVELLKCCVGHRAAETMLLEGRMYDATQARALGLVDQIADADDLMKTVRRVAERYLTNDARGFRALKQLIRDPIATEMRNRDPQGNRDFADLWYTPHMRENLKQIQIRR